MKKTDLLIIFLLFWKPFMGFSQKTHANTPGDILLQLKKLNTYVNVLYIAAHPDDENTALLSYLVNERGFHTAYLSLTRGDGGQNLIGEQQNELLGLIRTQELLAARGIDGAEQFFTRAVDFGFSKNPEETLTIWSKDSILADVVWVIRTFQPDVIITRFPTDGKGGHGHHTASAILAEEAFDAAADPKRFPEQLKYVKVWQSKRLLYNSITRFINPDADLSGLLTLDIGGFNPLRGQSYGEIAAQSRSRHQSQGFGSAAKRGPIIEYFQPLKGSKPKSEIFEDIQINVQQVRENAAFVALTKRAYHAYQAEQPEDIVPVLLEAYRLLPSLQDPYWRELKRKELEHLILTASGMWLEALVNDYYLTPGTTTDLKFSAINRSDLNIALNKITLPFGEEKEINRSFKKNDPYILDQQIQLAKDLKYTNPYWLEEKRSKGLFTVKNPTLIGRPERDKPLNLICLLSINGTPLNLTVPVIYKWLDPVKGERCRPVEVTPPVTINLDANVYLFPDEAAKKIKVTLQPMTEGPITGELKTELPKGWSATPSSISFTLTGKGDVQTLSFFIKPTKEPSEGALKMIAHIKKEQTYSQSIVNISYDHIPIQTLLSDAEAKLTRFPLNKTVKRLGYIPGAGDEVAACLGQIGYQVTILNDEYLMDEKNLAHFDAIVTGVRAYNVNNKMKSFYKNLMSYVNNGGNLIVQYNTNNFLSEPKSTIGPYPFTISRNRVTDEEAPVIMELKDHPVLKHPNLIDENDFENWIQERGLYFASNPDQRYVTPFSMKDPGEDPQSGSVIITQYGKGYFVYTGLSFFRQLPAGVTGAYRLFVNMIELGKNAKN